jgi:hypothetical protein
MLRIIVTVVESERFGGACATSGHERPRDGARIIAALETSPSMVYRVRKQLVELAIPESRTLPLGPPGRPWVHETKMCTTRLLRWRLSRRSE